jgi:menaquinone-specific isochorismate synthase
MESDFIHTFIDSGSIISANKKKLIIAWGEPERLAKPDSNDCCFYAPDFFLSNKTPWIRHPKCQEISLAELYQTLSGMDDTSEKILLEWQQPYQQLFHETFAELQENYQNQTLTKAVPFVFECAKGTISKTQKIKSLLNALKYCENNPVYLYGSWDQSSGVLGATPELLFRLQDNNSEMVETVACAGTRPFNPSQMQFIPNEKEFEEHQIVIEGIHDTLKEFGDVSIGETNCVNLPPISHLLTPIHLKLHKKFDFEKIAKALHPTPALGAYPKKAGSMWLLNYQTSIDRKRFGAPFGCAYPKGNLNICYVAIRNIQWECDKIMLGAGCGIVKNSERNKEWEEILLKIKATKQLLAL